MRSRFLHALSGVVLASVAVLATGCTHDTLTGGSQNLNMAYTPSPSGAGRFNSASFEIVQIKVLPADPEERKLFEPDPSCDDCPVVNDRILFLFERFSADLTLTAAVPISPIALSAGTYLVTFIEFTPPALVDTDSLPANPPRCVDGSSTLDAQSAPEGSVPRKFEYKDSHLDTPSPDNLDSLTFTIQPGQTSLSLTVDVPGLIAGYEAAFQPNCVPCTNCSLDPRPTFTGFEAEAFRTELLKSISIK